MEAPTAPQAEDHEMMETEEVNMAVAEDDDDIDEVPVFLGEGDAVEVAVDDTNVPMDDDEEVEAEEPAAPVENMAKVVIQSHSDPVYACTFVGASDATALQLLSGGGDDKAFWHQITASTMSVQSTGLESHYKFQDSVSTVANNSAFIGFDASKPPNPEWTALGGLDGSVVLYNATNNTTLQLEGPSSDIEWLCWHPKGGNVLLVGCNDATIWMYHIGSTSTNYKCLQVFVGHEDAVTCGTFSADGKVAVTGSADGTLRIWAPKTGKSKHVFRFHPQDGNPQPALTCIAANQGLILVGSEDGQAHVCHVANKKHIASLRHYDPTLQNNNNSNNHTDDDQMVPSGVEAVGFCPSNPNWCATGGMDGVLRTWDLANQGQCRQACTTEGDTAGITKLTWHPTLPLVLTATTAGQLHLWDARNGQLAQTLTGHADVINDMDVKFLLPTGHAVIVTASDDKTVRIFDLDIEAALAKAAAQQQQQ